MVGKKAPGIGVWQEPMINPCVDQLCVNRGRNGQPALQKRPSPLEFPKATALQEFPHYIMQANLARGEIETQEQGKTVQARTKLLCVKIIQAPSYAPELGDGGERNVRIFRENSQLHEALALVVFQQVQTYAQGLDNGLLARLCVAGIKRGKSPFVECFVRVI